MHISSKTVFAFSLVELSIVLVILGLLTGGILTGQSLIRASELRSVTTEFARYQTAANTFRDKYFALPGDMPNATRFWGASAVGSGAVSPTTPAETPTYNGDGDGLVAARANPSPSVFAHQEPGAFWQHLANAGLIEGLYSGANRYAGDGSAFFNLSFSTNLASPVSKISNAWWGAQHIVASTLNYTSLASGHIMMLSTGFGVCSGVAHVAGGSAVLTPEEMWNIDTKVDDGRPNQGSVLVANSNGSQGGWGCWFAASLSCMVQSATAWEYNLTSTGKSCAPIFRMGF